MNYQKPCKCGCGIMIWHFDKKRRTKDYVNIAHFRRGHPPANPFAKRNNVRKQFQKGHRYGRQIQKQEHLSTATEFKKGRKGLRGINHPNYKNGEYQNSKGYIFTVNHNRPSKSYGRTMLKHRVVWEDEHSACLLPWSDVHHKDKNRINNVWYNLQTMTK